MRKIIFAIPPEVHLLDVNGPAHLFYEAKELGAEIELFFISLNNSSAIKSSAGCKSSTKSGLNLVKS